MLITVALAGVLIVTSAHAQKYKADVPKDGTRSCGSTRRWYPGSIRAGSQEISNWWNKRNRWK